MVKSPGPLTTSSSPTTRTPSAAWSKSIDCPRPRNPETEPANGSRTREGIHEEQFYFFFSSRRRHTRCSRDWSSDVCSSDLHLVQQRAHLLRRQFVGRAGRPGRRVEVAVPAAEVAPLGEVQRDEVRLPVVLRSGFATLRQEAGSVDVP